MKPEFTSKSSEFSQKPSCPVLQPNVGDQIHLKANGIVTANCLRILYDSKSDQNSFVNQNPSLIHSHELWGVEF